MKEETPFEIGRRRGRAGKPNQSYRSFCKNENDYQELLRGLRQGNAEHLAAREAGLIPRDAAMPPESVK